MNKFQNDKILFFLYKIAVNFYNVFIFWWIVFFLLFHKFNDMIAVFRDIKSRRQVADIDEVIIRENSFYKFAEDIIY